MRVSNAFSARLVRALGWHLGRLLGRILPLRYFGRSGLAFGGALQHILITVVGAFFFTVCHCCGRTCVGTVGWHSGRIWTHFDYRCGRI